MPTNYQKTIEWGNDSTYFEYNLLTVKTMDGIGVTRLQCTYDKTSGKCPSRLATYTTL